VSEWENANDETPYSAWLSGFLMKRRRSASIGLPLRTAPPANVRIPRTPQATGAEALAGVLSAHRRNKNFSSRESPLNGGFRGFLRSMEMEKTQERKYEAITLENMRDTAAKAAYCTVRTLYRGQIKNAKNAVVSGADTLISRLYYAFRGSLANETAKLEAVENAGRETREEFLERAVDRSLETSATEADDCISVALEALYESLLENGGEQCGAEAFQKACRAVRAHVYREETALGTRKRLKYDADGNLLEASEYKYIRNPHMYYDNPDTGEIEDVSDGIERLIDGLIARETLAKIINVLAPGQKRVLEYAAKGYTNKTIGKSLGIAESTVRQVLGVIRKKARKLADAERTPV
jgi:DNA-directed RNA polymerase specialized sigma24 family protein